jgi:hypothetical protein
MDEREKLEALRAIIAIAKASGLTSEENDRLPAQFAVVERMIDDQQRYLDNPVSLAVHCMSLFADYLPFEMLAALVLSDKHLSNETIAVLKLGQELDGAQRNSSGFNSSSWERRTRNF